MGKTLYVIHSGWFLRVINDLSDQTDHSVRKYLGDDSSMRSKGSIGQHQRDYWLGKMV